MRCPHCGWENPHGNHHCGSRGAALPVNGFYQQPYSSYTPCPSPISPMPVSPVSPAIAGWPLFSAFSSVFLESTVFMWEKSARDSSIFYRRPLRHRLADRSYHDRMRQLYRQSRSAFEIIIPFRGLLCEVFTLHLFSLLFSYENHLKREFMRYAFKRLFSGSFYFSLRSILKLILGKALWSLRLSGPLSQAF